MTQRGLAQRAGTSAAAVCLYESGQRIPRVDTLSRLLAACDGRLDVRLTGPSPLIDVAENARALEAVLQLAMHLPGRRGAALDAPVFAQLAGAA